jgi:arylsulfatase B
MRAVLPPWRSGGLDTSEVTIADVLGRAGYTHRGIFGKWHLGHSSVRYHPLRRGFTEFVGHYNGAIDYFTHEREGELDWHRNYEPNFDKGYSTDLIGAAAASFIRTHAASGPFFCYVPFNAPHSPFQAKPEHLKQYAGLAPVPGEWEGQPEQRRKARQVMGAMIHSLDENIGRILDSIQRSGAGGNTLVLFFSDNGGVAGIGHNAPLNGAKASVFEGGIRVPAAIRWPAVIPGGRKITAPLANLDILPTLMSIVGVRDHGGKPLDGIDAFDVLTGKRNAIGRDLYSYIGQAGEDNEEICYITPEWKLVVLGRMVTDAAADDSKRRKLLFRIGEDPFEKHDLAAQHPDIVKRMYEKVKAFRALQPANSVPPFDEGREGFKPPKRWALPDLPGGGRSR